MKETGFLQEHVLNFDIDRYINPWIPHNRLGAFPKPVTRFLGYRSEPQKEPYQILQWPITFLATVASLCLVGGIGNYAPGIVAWHPPVIIASLGASAVLDFNTIKSPLAQPRNSVLGNTLAATCGVAIAKLFQLNSNFRNMQWVSGAVGCATASWVMSLTNTIHPPGGATAVLASTEAAVVAMGWKFIPLVLLDSTLMIVVALIFNNILRQYPLYWWTSANTGSKLRKEKREAKQAAEIKPEDEQAAEKGDAAQKSSSDTSSDRTLRRELSARVDFVEGLEEVRLHAYTIQLPPHVKLNDDELRLLGNIQRQLRSHGETNKP